MQRWYGPFHRQAGRVGQALLLVIAFLFTAQATWASQQIELSLAGELFELEYVADPDSRREGLMGRKHLPAGTGMLFDFPEGTQPTIWMRNMLISLDLLYINASGEIAQIFANVPPCREVPCEIYRASQPMRFVLEVPAGTVDRLQLVEGQKLALDTLLTQPPPSR